MSSLRYEYDEAPPAEEPACGAARTGPRAHPRHRERGPKVHCGVTYKAIAALVGRAPGTIRNLATGRNRRFDPSDLGSVVAFIAERRSA